MSSQGSSEQVPLFTFFALSLRVGLMKAFEDALVFLPRL